MKSDQFLSNFRHLAGSDSLNFAQKIYLAGAEREVRELRRLRGPQKGPKRAVKVRRRNRPKQVIGDCKICHKPWPHTTPRAKNLHYWRLLGRKGTKTRKRILAGGQPWGEKFREMGRAAMAAKYTARRVAAFKELAPRAFDIFGQRFVEDLINRRKHRYVKDGMDIYRRWVSLHYGGQKLKKPWVHPPPRPGRDAQGFKIR